MSKRKNGKERNEGPRVRYLDFWCPQCGDPWLIWLRRKGSPVQARIWGFEIIEGNSVPNVWGFFEANPRSQKAGHDSGSATWSCKGCGFVPTNMDGSPVHSVVDMVRFILINCDPYRREMNLDPTKSFEDLNQLIFNEIDWIFGTIHSWEHGLPCPSCGHDEAIEKKLLIIWTPVRVENGRPRWIYEERLWDEKTEGLGNSYVCSNCGFELPEPVEE